MSVTWNEYYQKVASQPHRPNVEHAANLLMLDSKIAIDAGCGTGRDSNYLLNQGFTVYAFDTHQDAVETCLTRFEGNPNFSISQSCFSDFDYPPCSLFIASASLFFCPSERFESVWQRINETLQPGGIFCGDLLGIRDSWVGTDIHSNISAFTREEVEALFDDYEIIHFYERDEDGTTAVGNAKHWHTFSITAIKR
ncbi:class I SAM-dependent methyltransferase [Vibrio campbellii]|uniref:class I SAM-dependent methyltransferase n=1 Tax=Vibrio campbellii TaxID=680 RepID=UPI001E371FEF|nr:class I SAM-dependent methyltransferase [Vibrio campbellii]MCC8251762.1 methyltransferase domain-containing protein [Vibrio campbellii CAIM 333]